MDESSKKFYEEIKAQKEKDRLMWNAAQEAERGMVFLPPEKENEIMERMFLVNTIEEQQKEIEELKKSNKVLKDIISADVKQNAKVDYVGKIPKKPRI